MSKSKGARSGMNWTLVSQNVAIGVVIVLLSPLVAQVAQAGMQLPFVGVLAAFFMPLAFVIMMTYFRSEQRTRGQGIAEGVFAGCIFLVVMTLMSMLFGLFGPPGA